MTIPAECLKEVEGKQFFYPCALHDTEEAVRTFWPWIRDFMFTDIHYGTLSQLEPFNPPPGLVRAGTMIDGTDNGPSQMVTDGVLQYRHVDPAIRLETFMTDQAQTLTIRRRHGFGQYSLLEQFADRSIGVFMHRGDSPGEAGSNTFFLGNVRKDHEPLSDLWAKLSQKLADTALIVSDGSNTRFRFLKRFHHRAIDGVMAFRAMHGRSWVRGGFKWQCVGFMENRYGPTLVWKVQRRTNPFSTA